MLGLTKGAVVASKGTILVASAVVATVAIGAIAYRAWQASEPVATVAATAEAPGALAPSRPVATATSQEAKEATPAPPSAAPPTQPARPGFDVVRVEPTGDTVVAGRAAPNADVALLDRGTVIAETKADTNGQFAFVPPLLPAGDHLLALEDKSGQAQNFSAQTVTVAVPGPKGAGRVVVALTEPDQPTHLLSDSARPLAAAATAQKPADASPIAIRTVEMEDGGGFFAAGSAASGAEIRLYLNGSAVADLHASQEGSWSLVIAKGMQPGSYDVRADQIDAVSGKVVARAEVPFDYKAFAVAEGDASRAAKDSSPNDAVVATISTVTVVHGDSLWRISRKVLGRGIRYTQIYAANAAQIRDPRLIYPGQVLVQPQPDAN